MKKRNNLMKEVLVETIVKIAGGRDVTELTDSELRKVLLEVEANPVFQRAVSVENDRREAVTNAFDGYPI